MSSNFLKVALPFMASVAGSNLLASRFGTPSKSKAKINPMYSDDVSAANRSTKLSNFLDIGGSKVGGYTDKFVRGISDYAKAGFTKSLEGMAGTSVTAADLARIGGSKVGTGSPLSFKAGAVDLKIPGSSNEKVMQKVQAAMQSQLFNQIVSASLKSSPRLGRTINLAQQNIKVKSRINPQTVKV
tara:strand:- start:206 stop:760 length:555 start_codon:yes stop_codon:yes gene_type:complete